MTEGPYFIVVKGTNQRWSTGKALSPKIFDTEEIAQTAIDYNRESNKGLKLVGRIEHAPISVAEYNAKYAKIMGIKED